VRARRVEIGTDYRDVIGGGQFAAEFEGVDFGSRLVPRQKIMDDVKDAQGAIIASDRRARAVSILRAAENP
jgi:hypothetical protein